MGDRRRDLLAGVACVNLATLTWAGNHILGRWLRGSAGPFTISAIRFAIAGAVFALLLAQRPAADRRLGRDAWRLVLMALVGVVLFSPTLYAGLRLTTAVNTALINGLGSVITVALAAAVLGERLTLARVGGAVVGLAGVAAIVLGGRRGAGSGHLAGDLVVLAAVLCWSVYSLLGRATMHSRSPLAATALPILLALPVLAVGAWWEVGRIPLRLTPPAAVALLGIGLLPSLVGFLAWNAGVQRLGSGGAMVFLNTLPLYGAVLGALVLHEPLGLHHLLGGLLIVAGSLWAVRSPV